MVYFNKCEERESNRAEPLKRENALGWERF